MKITLQIEGLTVKELDDLVATIIQRLQEEEYMVTDYWIGDD